MHDMTFFHLGSKSRAPLFKDGLRVSLNEVLRVAGEREVELWRKHDLPSRFVPSGFEPTPQMMATIQAICIALSGCEASIHDLKNIRRFMYRASNEYKRSIDDLSQVAPFLAYLLVGFRMHSSDDHKEDSNSVRDLVDFAVDLASTQSVHLTSFLCSHRGPSVPGGSWLAASLPEDQVRRALHLEMGILAHL